MVIHFNWITDIHRQDISIAVEVGTVAMHICLIPYIHADQQCLFAKCRWDKAWNGRDLAAVTNHVQFPHPFINKIWEKPAKAFISVLNAYSE